MEMVFSFFSQNTQYIYIKSNYCSDLCVLTTDCNLHCPCLLYKIYIFCGYIEWYLKSAKQAVIQSSVLKKG